MQRNHISSRQTITISSQLKPFEIAVCFVFNTDEPMFTELSNQQPNWVDPGNKIKRSCSNPSQRGEEAGGMTGSEPELAGSVTGVTPAFRDRITDSEILDNETG